jgi:hypothetical protein
LPLDGLEPAHRFSPEESLRVRATKGTDHSIRLYCFPVNVKQYATARRSALAARFAASYTRTSSILRPGKRHDHARQASAINHVAQRRSSR